ncbi:MAG: histone deacetylase [Chloroflexi bacterium]|nr:histone deacetylase [Chloroflexota bacterium]
MKLHNNPVFCTFYDAPEHNFPGHPESPRRLQHVQGWIQAPPYPEMVWLSFKPALAGDILLVHHKDLLQAVQDASRQGPHEIDAAPTYVTHASYHAALMAAGATLAVSRRILTEESGRGFAIVRPPGHHAEPDRAMGFCLFNNVAIAAADALARSIRKVAILDFDAHHGNGTQALFSNNPQVAYLSIHEENLYPGSGDLHATPHARGRIINVPMPSSAGPEAYLSVFQEIVKPWLIQFDAEMLMVSAGFDSHFSDPLTATTLDTGTFFQITRMLIDLADAHCHGRILFVLEGGYDPQALHDNLQACLSALCNRTEYPDHFGPSGERPTPVTSHSEHIETIKAHHQLRKD